MSSEDPGDARDRAVGAPEAPAAPATGDATVDAALTELAQAQQGSLEERIEAGERAQRLLQGRLGGLGEA